MFVLYSPPEPPASTSDNNKHVNVANLKLEVNVDIPPPSYGYEDDCMSPILLSHHVSSANTSPAMMSSGKGKSVRGGMLYVDYVYYSAN